jgi:hypothetical protein
MTIIKNHFEVFLVTSKKQGNCIIESKVGLYSIRPIHTYLSVKCHLWPRFRVRNSILTLIDFIYTEMLKSEDQSILVAIVHKVTSGKRNV